MAKKRKTVEADRPITSFEDVANSEDEFFINRDKILLDEGSDAKRRKAEKDDFLEQSDEEVLGYSSNDEDWGKSKRDYYDADAIETEADALEEEVEAKRLQRKKLQKMTDEDFGFDEREWQNTGEAVEVLKEVEITPGMGIAERERLLQARNPEFQSLANEFIQLPKHIKGESILMTAKRRALAAYVTALTMYFALLGTEDIQEHDVMKTLLQCRETWTTVKDVEEIVVEEVEVELSDESVEKILPLEEPQIDETEEEELAFSDLDNLMPKRKGKLIGKELVASTVDKPIRKKTLQFYTSQITQSSNRRSGAGRDAGGDADLPYRERLKDRQARLNSEAERRGKKLDQYGRGAALESDDEAEAIRKDEDDYYDMVSQRKKKVAVGPTTAERIIEKDAEGKRAIGYVIEKNKGLTPRRKKDVRNPRVKKRKKFEEKKKKLKSVRAVYGGGEGRGGYGGEATGIKTGLVKSIKL